MLYMTTRDKHNTFTSHKTLIHDYAPDGGSFVPFRLPYFEPAQINALKEKSFSQIVAELLNCFFSANLTGWDVEFCVGRNCCRVVSMNHRIVIAEIWHSPEADYSYIIKRLYKRLCNGQIGQKPTVWARTAIRIAVLFGIFGELLREQLIAEDQIVDISVQSGDFVAPMAAWFARKMGLPVGVIISTCDDDSAVWDLIHRGTFNTGASSDLCAGVEQLIWATLGAQSVNEYVIKCEKKGNYFVSEEMLSVLNADMFCAVAGQNRAATIINSIYRSNQYIADPDTAISFGGIQDYRAKNGGSRTTLLMAESSPLKYKDMIAEATGISTDKLIEYVKL